MHGVVGQLKSVTAARLRPSQIARGGGLGPAGLGSYPSSRASSVASMSSAESSPLAGPYGGRWAGGGVG